MSSAWQRLAEDRINDAIERGEFAGLPVGRSLDLTDYFSLPEADRMSVSMLRSAGVRPPELDLLARAEELERALANCAESEGRQRLTEELQTTRVAFALAMERRRLAARTREL